MRMIAAALFALLHCAAAAAATAEEDVARYVQIFSERNAQHIEAVQALGWMGVSDTVVFDIIERLATEEAQAARNSNAERSRISHYIRALGFSGQDKYAPTISGFTRDRAYERHANIAAADLGRYRKWNPVISNRAAFDPRYSDDVNRVLNMLRSDDLLLKRIGAKRVYFANKDEVLLESLTTNLRASAPRKDLGSDEIDSVAWMAKALGHAKNPKYRPAVQEAFDNAYDPKVRQYAKAALQTL